MKTSTTENGGELVKLKPGTYLVSGKDHDSSENFVHLEHAREAIILERVSKSGDKNAFLSLLDNRVIIVWQDQFEKIY